MLCIPYTMSTQPFYHDNTGPDSGPDILEIGVDEAGRGPLFGRVYTAAVILPKSGFDYSRMKDSKRFSGEKKILDEEMYIKEHALALKACIEACRALRRMAATRPRISSWWMGTTSLHIRF